MEKYTSIRGLKNLEHLSPSKLRIFIKKLCLLSSSYGEESKTEKIFSRAKSKPSEKFLRDKIHNLEEELKFVKQERDKALEKNTKQISEMNSALLSLKIKIKELSQEKEERRRRVMHLEKKIRREIA